ncbi:MAG: hypothetical protein J5931_01775 [Prevotella sp.]|nr:hypothetical protein [Prevotella sp.]
MKVLVLIASIMLLFACGGKKERSATSSQLVENVQQFGIDTIQTEPSDTLCNNSVDEVLRHYPELYNATQKAKKAYDNWSTLSKESGLRIKPATIDISDILDLTLFGNKAIDSDSTWQYLTVIDSLYIQALVNVPSGQSDTDKQKTAIGRTRKAWLSYIKQLQTMESTIPEECQQRYLSTIKEKTKQLADPRLYKLK